MGEPAQDSAHFWSKVPDEMRKEVFAAAEELKGFDGIVRVVSHFDADGACAGAVLCHALDRLGRRYTATLLRDLEPKRFQALKDDAFGFYVLADMGSAQLDIIETYPGRVVVLDHHAFRRGSDRVRLINPNAYGVDGGRECSASTLAFLLALAVDPRNADLADLALAGACGDKQAMGGFSGINRPVVDLAKQVGAVSEGVGLRFMDAPVGLALVRDASYFIEGVTGDHEGATDFLRRWNVPPDLLVPELDRDQVRRLASGLILRILRQGAQSEVAQSVHGLCYRSRSFGIEIAELASLVDAAGRRGKTGIALSAALGDREALDFARAIRDEYMDRLRAMVLRLRRKGLRTIGGIQYFASPDDAMSGAAAGVAMQFFADQTMPVIGVARVEGMTRLSARGTKELVKRGLDLAAACDQAASNHGGQGGGHPVAAGASVPADREQGCMMDLGRIVAAQLGLEGRA